MLVFDKNEIKESLSTEDIYNLLQEWGGEPEFTSFGIISSTIATTCPVKVVANYIFMKIADYLNATQNVIPPLIYLN